MRRRRKHKNDTVGCDDGDVGGHGLAISWIVLLIMDRFRLETVKRRQPLNYDPPSDGGGSGYGAAADQTMIITMNVGFASLS